VPNVRQHLSADALLATVRERFQKVSVPRLPTASVPLADALMSAFPMFTLKAPSLLAFQERRSDANLKALFGIEQIPSDTQLREIHDEVDPEELRPAFADVFRQLQRGKALEAFEFYNGHYLLSLDGTGYFSSQKVHCPCCQVKHHRNGSVTYEHHMLGAVLVHPDHAEVLPLAPEPTCGWTSWNTRSTTQRGIAFCASPGSPICASRPTTPGSSPGADVLAGGSRTRRSTR
jgi:hypothetical protein